MMGYLKGGKDSSQPASNEGHLCPVLGRPLRVLAKQGHQAVALICCEAALVYC